MHTLQSSFIRPAHPLLPGVGATRHDKQMWRAFLSPAQSICPGMVDTDFLSVYSQAVHELPKLQSDDVAKAVLYALDTPDGVQVEDIVLQQLRKVDWNGQKNLKNHQIICIFNHCYSQIKYKLLIEIKSKVNLNRTYKM